MIRKTRNWFSGSSYRKWLLVAALVFLAGMALGIFPPAALQALLIGQISDLQNVASLFPPYEFSTFIFILSKNVISLLVSFILSPLLDILPLISLFTNGWVLGFVGAVASGQRGILFVLLGILPHGIFELTAFFIGEAAALSFGAAVIQSIFNRQKRAELPDNLKTNLARLGVAMALLIPAALIETYVTPLLAGI